MTFLVVALLGYVALTCLVCAAAILFGDDEVRLAAIAFLLIAAASQAAALGGPHWRGPEWGILAFDVAYFAILAQIACRSSSFWPIWAAACQMNGCLTHLAPYFAAHLPARVYATTQPFWALPILVAIAFGTLRSLPPGERKKAKT